VSVNREGELNHLDQCYRSDRAQLFILYRRRRVGKTELLRAFCEGKPHVFFIATLIPTAINWLPSPRPFGSSIATRWRTHIAHLDPSGGSLAGAEDKGLRPPGGRGGAAKAPGRRRPRQQERLSINEEAGEKIAPIEALVAEAEEMTLYREAQAQMKIIDSDLQEAEQRLGHIEADAAFQTFAQRAQAAAREAAEKARAQLAKAGGWMRPSRD